MSDAVQFGEFWVYHLTNYVLAALMYSLLARFVLSFVFEPGSTNYIFRFFVRITNPIARAVAFFTPRAVPPLLVILLAAVWMLMLRFTLYVGLAGAGLAPGLTG
ncbi:hypothetical protein ACUN0C_00625 [Faunimonas sp. B44]|uniref:hypothetical protein n=1 Tax=Faunimonas sp. B44 TaxID=3461493 RepID=UPI0040439798